MRKKITLLLVTALVAVGSITAQELSYNIKAGLNFSRINGPSEMSAGTDLETRKFTTGFHLGLGLNVGFLEESLGVTTELMFSQKGGKLRYNGPGTATVTTSITGEDRVISGTLSESLTVVNSHLEIPVLLFYKPVERIKISVGPSIGFRLGGTASGERRLDFVDGAGTDQSIIIGLDYNYNKDNPGEATNETLQELTFDNGGITVQYPTEIGAYYGLTEDQGNFFKVIDFGLNADLTFYATEGIGFGIRANYGVFDITNNDIDFSRQDGSQRSDKDSNLTFQVSLGFNF